MKCPNCNIPLMMADRKGVEIDFCSQCRGVWLDKGELDKIIELSVGERFATSHKNHKRQHSQYTQADSYGQEPYAERDSQYRDRRYYKSHSQRPYYKYKKKKSLMGQIFDVFD